MKKVVLIAGAMLALTSSLALAGGSINIAWDDCTFPYGVGVADKTVPCLTTGASVLVASFDPPPPGMPHFNGSAGVVDIQVAGPVLDPWWRLDPAGCRAGKLTGSFDFTSGPFSCVDVWSGLAAGGTDVSVLAADRLRVRTVCAVPTVAPILNGYEYYVFKLTLSMANPSSCVGCEDPACVVFNSLLLTQPAGEGDFSITTGPVQFATWRGGAIPGGCPATTPTHKSTWGSVKALYR